MKQAVDVSAYAFAHGVRHTRTTLRAWQRNPGAIVGRWVAGSAFAAVSLLAAVWLISSLDVGHQPLILRPPFVVGDGADVVSVLAHNMLVLGLHAMACVAGFIAGSSLPLQAQHRHGISRWVHEHGGRLAIAFVIGATTFSLSAQAYLIGRALGRVAGFLGVAPGLLLLAVLPHALPELVALFLPLAAWIMASRRGQWEQLLAATFVTVAIAMPVLLTSAAVEVYVAPHLFTALTHIHATDVRLSAARPSPCMARERSRPGDTVRAPKRSRASPPRSPCFTLYSARKAIKEIPWQAP
jgi:hypothetical protein